ncbi:DUF2231 domain-containing protein [Brevundimonas sp. R86498]|uniref:DUF2231 domain-containing protein n=1 Tax=Brevundimonas sp. R86498 TaxID=3093845 RepID=UPI0037C7C450
MPDTTFRPGGLNPIHAILLAFPMVCFSAALVTDIAYLRTAEIQWTNFSSWLIAGGLVFTGMVLAWALVSLAMGFRSDHRLRAGVYAGLLAVLFVIELVNAFQHSRDGWSSVGTLGLLLSILGTALAIAAGVVAHSRLFSPETVR